MAGGITRDTDMVEGKRTFFFHEKINGSKCRFYKLWMLGKLLFKLFRQVQALSTILSSGRLPFFGNFAIVTGTLPLKLPKKVNFRLKTG